MTKQQEKKLDRNIGILTDKLDPKEPATRVVFRKWKDSGEIIALFPDLNYANGAANFGNIMSYMRVGQHGEAHESLLRERKRFVKATPAEYADLLKELTGIGYDLKVRR